jgi:hypothetical protein
MILFMSKCHENSSQKERFKMKSSSLSIQDDYFEAIERKLRVLHEELPPAEFDEAWSDVCDILRSKSKNHPRM